MSFPKKGKFFPNKKGSNEIGEGRMYGSFVDEISTALRRSLGDTRAGVKTVSSWTGANEKTVKNWFGGKYGPSGAYLIALVRHSDEILGVFLAMAGREDLMISAKFAVAEKAIEELLDAVRSVTRS